jgi:acyl carrier protein
MQNTFEKVKTIISDYIVVDKTDITFEKNFAELGFDSIDLVKLFILIEDEFDIEINDKDSVKILNVESLVKYIETQLEY